MSKYDLLINCIRNREALPEPVVSLRKLLKSEGTEVYLRLCGRRISKAHLVDEKSIIIDPTDLDNLIMKYHGLLSARKILSGYCDEDRLYEIILAIGLKANYFMQINREYFYYRMLDARTLRKLKKQNFNVNSDYMSSENLDIIRVIAAEELQARKLHNIIKRKIVKTANAMRKSWKYIKNVRSVCHTQYIDGSD